MSKNPKPTIEELRYIYQKILAGSNDADILAEYASKYDSGQLMFPYRTDTRFLRERRREMEAAQEVLEEYIKRKVDPVISQRRQEHFVRLGQIGQSLLKGYVGTVQRIGNNQQDYSYQLVDTDGGIYATNLQYLAETLEANEWYACRDFSDWDFFNSFIPHLIAESTLVAEKGWEDAVTENPYEIIDLIRILSSRRTFKGTCPICKDW
jgi:hypothetical protein